MTDAAARLAQLALEAPARAGGTRVLAVDGRSGAGKSTVAAAVAYRLSAPVLTMERMYSGWEGLRAGIEALVGSVLSPLAAGLAAEVPHYDWRSGGWRRPDRLEPPEVLVVEGVGAGALAAARYVSVLAWVELDEASRRARAMAREGAAYEGHWEQWSAQEQQYLRSDHPAQRADVILAGARDGGTAVVESNLELGY
jgi:uridine kinase